MDPKISRIASKIIESTDVSEGALSVPDGQVIAHLSHFISAKYSVEIAYRNFSDRIKGLWRDSLVEHWHKHAQDERQSTYDLSMKLIGLGGDPVLTMIQIPVCTSNVIGFHQILMKMELEAIEAGRTLIQMAGQNTGLKVLAENTVLLDSHHLDDLKRMGSYLA